MFILALLMTCLYNEVSVVVCDKTPITCNAGIFSARAPASVVCNFHKDVIVHTLALIVMHWPKGTTPDLVGTEVLTCERTEKIKYECKWKDGFMFDGVLKEHLTLRIPSVNATFAGLYMCFVEPAETTDPQLCELSLQEPDTVIATSSSEEKKGGSGLVLSIVIPVLVVLAASIIVVVVICWRRHERWICKNRQRETRQHNDESMSMICKEDEEEPMRRMPMIEPIGPHYESRPTRVTEKSKLKIDFFMKGLKLNDQEYQNVMELMAQDLTASSKGNSEGSVKAYPVQLRSLPHVTEYGTCLVVELSSTKVKVYRVLLYGLQTNIQPMESYDIPLEMRRDKDFKLFSFIADCLETFLTANRLSEKKFRLGFVFSFPCKQDEGLGKATLTEWTKGFDCTAVAGEDVGELLQKALQKKFTPCYLEVNTVLNEAVGTLITVSCTSESSCQMAVALSNGFDICFMQEGSDEIVNKMLTKTELGMLGENGRLDRYITDYDREVDRCSIHPGKHILEKMVSMMHIGEVVRQVLKTLIAEDLLFCFLHNKHDVLSQEGTITTEIVSLIGSDTSDYSLATRNVLMQLHVEKYTDKDCRTVAHVCQVVLQRAAFMAAAGLAAMINHVNQNKVTVAVDGDLYRYNPTFYKLLESKTRQLIKRGLTFKLHPIYYGSVCGSALMTVSFKSRTNCDRRDLTNSFNE